MKRMIFVMMVSTLSVLGCTGDDGPDDVEADADADADVGTDGGDADADADADSGTYDYPEPPYGREVGTVIENLSFTGDGEIVTLEDFHQDGDARLLMVWGTAGWCTVCRYLEKPALQTLYAEYHDQGLEILGVVYEDDAAEPVTLDYARAYFAAEPYPWVADPLFDIGVYFDRAATPLNMFVNLETMEITNIEVGYSETVIRNIIEAQLGL